jgi:hypothetical protein
MTPRVCAICGDEITARGVREFDEVTRRVIDVCRECRAAAINRDARDAHEDTGARLNDSD